MTTLRNDTIPSMRRNKFKYMGRLFQHFFNQSVHVALQEHDHLMTVILFGKLGQVLIQRSMDATHNLIGCAILFHPGTHRALECILVQRGCASSLRKAEYTQPDGHWQRGERAQQPPVVSCALFIPLENPRIMTRKVSCARKCATTHPSL